MTWKSAQRFGVRLALAIVLTSGATVTTADAAGDDRAPAVPRRGGSLPIAAAHRYRMAAKIRPLLLFWIGRDSVGEAQVVWRRGQDGAVGFELLIGSDPARAPRRINRWGYIAEQVSGSQAHLLGVMKQSNEQSLDEAKAKLAAEAHGDQFVFKAIQSAADASTASSRTTTIRVARDLTFRDVEALLNLVARDSTTGTVRHARLPSGTRPGFLVALTELIHRSVEAHSRSARFDGAQGRPSAAGGKSSLPYIFNGTLCDLTLLKSEFLREARVGARHYRDVVRARFEARNRATGTATEFELLCGTSGGLVEIPVHAVYQPRWWLQVELFLDQADQS